VQGWAFNVRTLRRTLEKRAVIQRRRVVPDRRIVRSMYWGSGKLRHVIDSRRHV
jgi:hypothetical protein